MMEENVNTDQFGFGGFGGCSWIWIILLIIIICCICPFLFRPFPYYGGYGC